MFIKVFISHKFIAFVKIDYKNFFQIFDNIFTLSILQDSRQIFTEFAREKKFQNTQKLLWL